MENERMDVNAGAAFAKMAESIDEFETKYTRMQTYGYSQFMIIFMDEDEDTIERCVKEFRENTRARMSEDSRRNKMYLFVLNVGFASEAAIALGMPQNEALAISSVYIQECDKQTDENIMADLFGQMLSAYKDGLKKILTQGGRESPVVRRAKDFIGYSLHSPIKLKDVAENVGMSPAYFSTIFNRETGTTLNRYIHEVRINEAKNLLAHTDKSCVWIANSLCYNSQSHFSYIFKKLVGMTPNEYRRKYTA